MASPKKSASKKRSATKAAGKTGKGLIFPTGRIGTMLRKGRFAKRVSKSAGVFLTATLEYLAAELLGATARAVQQSKKKTTRVTPRAVCLAVRHDADLGELLKDVTFSRGGVVPNVHKALEKKKRSKKGKKSQ
jgi:histone H2A